MSTKCGSWITTGNVKLGDGMKSAAEALHELKRGNQRFLDGVRDQSALTSQRRRRSLQKAQSPLAVILCCSDSRVPPEIIFDQGLGDLFVVRVGGNVVTPTQVGSIEFAVDNFKVPLVVVLGHTWCGSVREAVLRHHATRLAGRDSKDSSLTAGLKSILDCISPTIESLVEAGAEPGSDDLWMRAVRPNIHLSVAELKAQSEMLNKLVQSNRLNIIGAEYSLATGEVDFFGDGQD